MLEKERNNTVDLLRGIAMLLVILGHTMTGSTANAQDSFLYNIVWTLQMPLFILISGYVTKYSKNLKNLSLLGISLARKTLAYLLPWAVWTFLVRGIIFGQTTYLNIQWLLHHMDSGYWFLFTIWTITVLYGIADFLSEKCNGKGKLFVGILLRGIFYVVTMLTLAAVGWKMGLDFLGIKLTLYYMPFYFAGHLYGQLEEVLRGEKYIEKGKDALVVLCRIFWFALMNRYNFYTLGDGAFAILLRATASLTGCIALCGLLAKACSCNLSKLRSLNHAADLYKEGEAGASPKICGGGYSTTVPHLLQQAGVHSLELYLIHYLVLTLIKPEILPELQTPMGALLLLFNYALTLGLAAVAAFLLNQNRYLRLILFGKRR